MLIVISNIYTMFQSRKGCRNSNWKGGISSKEFICEICENKFYGHHSRKARFCSVKCFAKFKRTLKKDKSPRWQGGIREKKCEGCNSTIEWKPKKPYSSFLKQKFCSKECADKNGFRYKKENHPNWKGGTQPRDMTKQAKWGKQVFERDNYTCQECGQRGGNLHAHHIKGFTENKKDRWKLENGQTLCIKCHYKTYKFYGNQHTESMEKDGELLGSPNI